MKIKLFTLVILAIIMLSGCATYQTKIDTFPRMYETKPTSILILPPINLSTAPEAKEYFMSTLTETATETGYYFLPLEVTTPFLASEGLYDTEVITDTVLTQFYQYFEADAVLITKILEWDKSYYVVGGNVTVSLDFAIKSTITKEILWNYAGKIIYNTTDNSNSNFLVSLIATAIKTAATDYVPIAKGVNKQVLDTVPVGQYHPKFDKDQKDQVKIDQFKKEPLE
ncbi:GNA1162 family protein [Candidatus Cloacimonadota bacterium]